MTEQEQREYQLLKSKQSLSTDEKRRFELLQTKFDAEKSNPAGRKLPLL